MKPPPILPPKVGQVHLSRVMPFPHTLTLPIFWGGAVLCAIAEAAVILQAFSPQLSETTAPAGDDTPASADRNVIHSLGRSSAVEVVWTLIPAVVLALVFWWTWVDMHPAPASNLPARLDAPAPHGVTTPASPNAIT
jgi:hypothetical protein